MVLENGRFAYLSMPPQFSTVAMAAKLCVLDHRRDLRGGWDPLALCCLQEVGHVHAHVHQGESTQDIFLEQCMEDAGCALPMVRELAGSIKHVPTEVDHHHGTENCGHDLIAHGDHFDCLVPLHDGSYMLSHAQRTETGNQKFIEHGRLVKVGETLGKLKRRPKQLLDLFSFESPRKQGYEILSNVQTSLESCNKEKILKKKAAGLQSSRISKYRTPKNKVENQCCTEKKEEHWHDTTVTIPKTSKTTGLSKTTIDVMGICCPNEVPLIKKLLEPIPGVEEVSVNVTSKTVTVLHDQLSASSSKLVKALNDASMVASVHQRGEWKAAQKWPSPWTIASGILLGVSFFQYLYHPLKWVALGSVGVGIPPLVLRSIAAMKSFILDINILMLIAVGGAIGLGDYLEAGSIAFLFTLADWLESRSSDKARAAIAAVVDLAPRSATLLSSGMGVRVEEVKVGTLLTVKAGELVPIDGTVTSGKCNVDESSLTGESLPVEKDVGSIVWAGTVNMSGHMTVKTTALAEDSAVSRMVRLVEEAQTQRSRTELLVEQIAKYYTPGIVLAAIIIAVVPWALHVHSQRHWLYLALVLLVVACPCALVISTPVVTTCGIAQAARLGLLLKGGSHLEILGKLKVVALDKTGTLSEGHFRVTDIVGLDGGSNIHQILHWIASVENKASHPMATALVSFANQNGVKPSEHVTDFEVIVGEGVKANVNGRIIHIGNARMANRLGWDKAVAKEMIHLWSSQGATVGWIGVDNMAVGVYGVADQLRTEAVEAVRNLKKLGIKVAMLTGDSASAASFAHKKIGEIEIHAQLLPEDKVHMIQELKKYGTTAMVGDGINDAPALAAADVGIAMGVAGSAVAMETADVALMTNDLRKLAIAVELGRNCRWKIGQNVTLSFVTKIVIIGLAASGYASLWTAVMADVGTCLLVIFNSMRLLRPNSCSDHCCTTKEKQKAAQCATQHLSIQGKADNCCSKSVVNKMLPDDRVINLCDDTLCSDPLTQAPRSIFPWLKKHHGHHRSDHLHEVDKSIENEKLSIIGKQLTLDCTSSASCCSSSSCHESESGAQNGKEKSHLNSLTERVGREEHHKGEDECAGSKSIFVDKKLTMPKQENSSQSVNRFSNEELLIKIDEVSKGERKFRDKCNYDLPSIDSSHSHEDMQHEHLPIQETQFEQQLRKTEHPALAEDQRDSSACKKLFHETSWVGICSKNLSIETPQKQQEETHDPTSEVTSPCGLAVFSSLDIFAGKAQIDGLILESNLCAKAYNGPKVHSSRPNSARKNVHDSLKKTNSAMVVPTPFPASKDITKETNAGNDYSEMLVCLEAFKIPIQTDIETNYRACDPTDTSNNKLSAVFKPSHEASNGVQSLMPESSPSKTGSVLRIRVSDQSERVSVTEGKLLNKNSRLPVLKHSVSDRTLSTIDTVGHPHSLDKPDP
ncbi:uncharacterized protein [Physcomitrium patens]